MFSLIKRIEGERWLVFNIIKTKWVHEPKNLKHMKYLYFFGSISLMAKRSSLSLDIFTKKVSKLSSFVIFVFLISFFKLDTWPISLIVNNFYKSSYIFWAWQLLATKGTRRYFIPLTIKFIATIWSYLNFSFSASLASLVGFFSLPLTRSNTLFFLRIRSIIFLQILPICQGELRQHVLRGSIALCPWCQRGGRPWVTLGCHQVQRGRFLALWHRFGTGLARWHKCFPWWQLTQMADLSSGSQNGRKWGTHRFLFTKSQTYASALIKRCIHIRKCTNQKVHAFSTCTFM